MKTSSLTTSDGIELRYGYAVSDLRKPWIVLVIPFGLDVGIAAPFFDFFKSHYNVCTWESRSVLEKTDRSCAVSEFSIDQHVADLVAVIDTLKIGEAILVGYCSGAGVALAAINQEPNRFSQLVLAHGEYTMLSDKQCVTQFAADMDVLLTMAAGSDKHAQMVFEKIQSERYDAKLQRPDGLDQPFGELRFMKRYAKNYLAYKSTDYEQLAAEVSHPTLLMAGARDVQVNVASSEKIGSKIRNATLFIDPDADHYGVLTRDSSTLIAIWNHIVENNHARDYRTQYS